MIAGRQAALAGFANLVVLLFRHGTEEGGRPLMDATMQNYDDDNRTDVMQKIVSLSQWFSDWVQLEDEWH